MSSFHNLLNRLNTITEAKASPYAGSHPSFSGITSKMRSGGLSSAPLDTIKFIRETLYNLDIIDDSDLQKIKSAPGFTGKKQAMLAVLKAKQQEINAKSKEIADKVNETLDDFINGVGINRGREEKYAAQAAAQEVASQMRQTKSGKQMDDALTDIVADESLLVKTAVAKILADIQKNLGEPGFDIEQEALSEVLDYTDKLNSLANLKSFINQIKAEPGYEKIAAYLSAAVKPIAQGTEDEEMSEDAEDDFDLGQSEDLDPGYGEVDTELSEIAQKFGFTSVEPGPNTYQSRMYEVEDLYTTTDSIGDSVYFGKHNYPRASYFVAYADGRVNAKSPSDLIASIKLILVGKDPEDEYKPEDEEYSAKKADIDKSGDVEEWEKAIARRRGFKSVPKMVGESYTSHYLTEQTKKDGINKTKKDELVSFKNKYKPKTSWQLEELRRYGL